MSKQLRSSCPRRSHAQWEPPADRRDPIEILEETSQGRIESLLPIRYGRMAASPFAFLRGSAAVMAADLAQTPNTGLRVQACGDCHLLNFGGFATPERSLIFDLNDFDETLPGPWEWDLKRLATSFVMACRHRGYHSFAQGIAQTAVRAYRRHMARLAGMSVLEVWYSRVDVPTVLENIRDPDWKRQTQRVVRNALAKTVRRDFPRHTISIDGKVRIKDNPPLIYHLPEEKELADFHDRLHTSMQHYRETLPADRRVLVDRYRFQDSAMKVVGVGSVGTRCMIALMMASDHDPLFLQVKQARKSVLEPYFGSAYEHEGERVVVGQRLMQAASDIFLGWTHDANGRHYYIRQLKDAKMSVDLERQNPGHMQQYARVCGHVLARAHARSGDPAGLSGYMGSNETFDLAIGQFAMAYADQTERDHALLLEGIDGGRLPAFFEAGR